MEERNHDNDKTRSRLSLPKGSRVCHYEIIKKIGSGGMGEVYLAEDTQLNRTVALKFLPDLLLGDQTARTRFQREARAAARLDHPNIIHIYEVADFESRPFFAMQFVDGCTLKDYLRKQSLSAERVIEIAIEICQGLCKAHESGVVHRDIKPTNIMIDQDDKPRLVDFGLATIQGTEKLTKNGSTLGTLAYMSPEQVRGEQADRRSDVFSFGVVLYEMLIGQNPFQKENDAATLHAIVNDQPSPLSRSNRDIPQGMQAIIDKALEKERGTRYQHIDDLLADLKRAKRELPGGLEKTSEDRKPVARRTYSYLLGAVFVVLLLLLAVPDSRDYLLELTGVDKVPDKTYLVVLPFTNLAEGADSQAFCDGLMETLTSRLTQLEQFRSPLWVVPASAVREEQVTSPRGAQSAFGVTHAVTGSVQRLGDKLRMTLNLVDVVSERQLRSYIIDDSLVSASALQDSLVIKLMNMLKVELGPQERDALTQGGTSVAAAYDLYLQGRGYLRLFQKVENVDSAITLFRAAIEKAPDFASAYAGLGEAYWRRYQFNRGSQSKEMAIQNCHLALELNDRLTSVYVTIGLIHEELGQYEEAVSKFRHAIELDPVNRQALNGLGRTFEAMGMFDDAERAYERAVTLKSDYWSGNLELAFFLVNQGRPEEAAQQGEHILETNPTGFVSFNQLGALYYFLGQQSQAKQMWERSLAIEPNYGACSNLGTLHYMEGRYSDAARMYETALGMRDHEYQIVGNLAAAYYWIPGRRDEATVVYKRAIQLAEIEVAINPRDPEPVTALAEYYASIGENSKALSLIAQAISMAPDDVDIMISAATVYEVSGNRDTAIDWLVKAFEKGCSLSQIDYIPVFQQLLTDSRVMKTYQSETEIIEGNSDGGKN